MRVLELYYTIYICVKSKCLDIFFNIKMGLVRFIVRVRFEYPALYTRRYEFLYKYYEYFFFS